MQWSQINRFIHNLFKKLYKIPKSVKAEEELVKLQQQLNKKRFNSIKPVTKRKVSKIHIKSSEKSFTFISKSPIRIYIDNICTKRESGILKDGLIRCISSMRINPDSRNISGETAINPLILGSESLLGGQVYAVAHNCVEKVQKNVEEAFNLKKNQLEISGCLLTQLNTPKSGDNQENKITQMLESYATPHIDKANRYSYDISTILYLNNSSEWINHVKNEKKDETDEGFDGGRFAFNDEDGDVVLVPREGRLLMFTSGAENLHQVQMVKGGARFTLAVWFRRVE